MQIILAEDEPAIRVLLARALRRHGAEVTECGNAAEAITAGSGAFDGAVVDAQLPDASGIDVAVELARRNPGARCIICSGAPIQLPDSGSFQFLQKPFRIDQLLGMLGLGP